MGIAYKNEIVFCACAKPEKAYVENVEQYEIHKGRKEYGAYASKG